MPCGFTVYASLAELLTTGIILPGIDYPQTRNLMETKVPKTTDDTAPATLTGAQMLDIRTRALTAAVSSVGDKTLPEIAHAAGCFLEFLLNGQPITVIGQTIRETGGAPAEPAQPVGVTAVTAAATTAVAAKPAKSTTKEVTAAAKPAAKAAAKPDTVAAPTTLAEAAEHLKKLVVNAEANPLRGRAAAEALLKEFGVTLLNQIPAPRLAAFQAACDAVGMADPAPTADDPLKGLV